MLRWHNKKATCHFLFNAVGMVMDLRARPTRQKRSAKTQRKLIDAAIDCLIEDGLGKLTTTEVCRRAGTSQGSIFKHFPNKAALISSAIEALYDQLLDAYRDTVTAIPPDADLVDACVDALWALFQTPKLLAVFDLHISARTDPVLREVVAPMERAHRAKIRDIAALIFPDARHKPHFLRGIEIVINSVQGAAVGSMALREEEVLDELIAGLKMIARHFLETNHD
jgi:AcrR family transcriptional regulator